VASDPDQSLQYSPWRAVLPHLAFVLLMGLFLTLAGWQWQRAGVRRALLEEAAARAALPALSLPVDPVAGAVTDRAAALRGRLAQARGRYAGPEVLWDNQVVAGRVGYAILAPFHLAGGAAILVLRGFVPLGASRAEVPPLPPAPAGEVALTGRIRLPAHPAWLRAGPEAERLAPAVLRVQWVDPDTLGWAVGLALPPYLLDLTPGAPGALAPLDPPPEGFGPERNIAYMVQWLGLAAVVAGFYGAYWHRRRRQRGGSPQLQ